MRYLCASLTKSKKVIIDLQIIVEHIYNFKTENEQLQYMFEDIEFRKGINNVTSNDIAEGINNLQTFGLVGKLNPKYEKLIIYLTEEEADTILEECDCKRGNDAFGRIILGLILWRIKWGKLKT